jgi:arylsulfatase
MDQGVGRILDKLDALKIADNTLVLFLSDNGACAENVLPNWYDVPSKTRDGRPIHVGNEDKTLLAGPEESFMSYGPLWANVSNTPFRSFKHFVYEGGIATPLIARWPDRIARPGEMEKRAAGQVIDILPTCLDAAGSAYPTTFKDRAILPAEGTTLLPTLQRGGNIGQARTLFWEHEGNRAVRVGDWKLVASRDQPWQLFDLAKDRTELHDVAPDQPQRVAEMSKAYDGWAQRCGVLPWPVKPADAKAN